MFLPEKCEAKPPKKTAARFYNILSCFSPNTPYTCFRYRDIINRKDKTKMDAKKSYRKIPGGGGYLGKNGSWVCASDKGTFFTTRKSLKGVQFSPKRN